MNGKICNAILVRALTVGESAAKIEPETLYIKDGKFSEAFAGPFDYEIDAAGQFVFPGFIDCHAHLRDPGFEYKEDIESGTRSAAAGGFTSVCCMPNTQPVCDNASVVRYIKDKARAVASVNVWPIGAVSKGMQGLELAEIGLMKEAGIVAVSDDGAPVATADLMRKAMVYANDFDLVVFDHCEDMSLAKDGVMNEGPVSMEMGVRGIPTVAEDMQIARDILLSEYLDLPVHICHVSTKTGVELIRNAKKKGLKITAETCPHYFTLTEEDCRGYDSLRRVNPPLRQAADVKAIIEGLADGTLDILATDHAPHHDDEKDIEFSLAKNGMLGFETAFALAYEILVKKHGLALGDLSRMLCAAPEKLLKIGRGAFDLGAFADFVIIDLDKTWQVDRFKTKSKSHNSPYHGRQMYGRVERTFVSGKEVYHAEL